MVTAHPPPHPEHEVPGIKREAAATIILLKDSIE
jgi:hypothetical protein